MKPSHVDLKCFVISLGFKLIYLTDSHLDVSRRDQQMGKKKKHTIQTHTISPSHYTSFLKNVWLHCATAFTLWPVCAGTLTVISNCLARKPLFHVYRIGSKSPLLMVRGSSGTCQKIQTGWSQPFPSQEVLLGWLMLKVVGTSNALHLKAVQKSSKITLWKY